MASDLSQRPEILMNCRFYFELHLEGSNESVDAFFMECKGFKTSQQVIEICEVTPNKWGASGNAVGEVVRTKIPGNLSFTNMTLRRGLTLSMTLWNWLESVQTGNWKKQRRDGSIQLYTHGAKEEFRFEFKRAWPVSYNITDLKSDPGEIEMEELEIAVEELKRIKA
ncbi:phage tail protein [Limnofasciculus baicalensis]|uniref:Phage tail protein n=1 Tax=Limnofasciculus baicalensis BBK-W-15 TaxID=2699891 RepID=A0AAE3KTL1_9CYAN|nr:phage tail protein [Limnofasciculus baicalensis]MCP2730637.1 phage tail protein [Limnofasciculus baicalensis BBK-W-15]